MNLRGQKGRAEMVVEIDRASEPLRRNWNALEKLFLADREALRRKDAIACAALEMAESMDKFLGACPKTPRI